LVVMELLIKVAVAVEAHLTQLAVLVVLAL
jgi:hypothetical protein